MTSPTFFEEFKSRAAFVAVIALSNPVILTFYVIFSRSGPGALEFWAAGMFLITVSCVICLMVVAMVLRADRAKRFRAAKVRKRMDHEEERKAADTSLAGNRS
jgi:threonine/homoserine/homoserine lactone efflux protein